MTSDSNALLHASEWVADVATGSIATGIATIAVASVGFAMLTGRLDVRRGATVVAGCFIVLGAPTIVAPFMKWAFAGDGISEQAAREPPPPAAAPNGPPVAQPFDPYAGASLLN